MNTLLNEIFTLQSEYWAINKDEKETLLAQFPDSLEWKELLRLHHLLCMEALDTRLKEQQLEFSSIEDQTESLSPMGYAAAPDPDIFQLLQETTNKLLSDESPYRPRFCEIEFDILTRQKSLKKITGVLMNASLTHLGSIEIIQVDPDLHPVSVEFLPLDQVQSIMNNSRGALITYKDKKEKAICYLASHYYFSPACRGYITNAETEYICLLSCNATEEPGIGLGVQELIIDQNNNIKEYTKINKNIVLKMIPDRYEVEYDEKVI